MTHRRPLAKKSGQKKFSSQKFFNFFFIAKTIYIYWTKIKKKDKLFFKSEPIGGHSFSLFFSKKRVFGKKMKILRFSQKIFLGQKKNFFLKSGSTGPRLPQSYIRIQKNELKKICLRKKKTHHFWECGAYPEGSVLYSI